MRSSSIVIAAATCVVAAAGHADAIYRCSDGAGGVLYRDTPCSGGRVVEIAPSRADPAARERLQREIDAFDKRQAARDAAMAREREQQADQKRRAEADARRAEAEARRAEELDASTYPYAYGFAPYYVPPRLPPVPRPRPIRSPDSFVPLR